MVFKSGVVSGTGFMDALSKHIGTSMIEGVIVLPDTFGEGTIKSYRFGPIRMMVSQCMLNEDIILKRTGAEQGKDEITFSFRNLFSRQSGGLLPSVQVSSSDIDLEISICAGTVISNILLTVHAGLIKDLLNDQKENALLQHIISGNEPYLYDEIMSPEIQQVAADIVGIEEPERLRDFYLRLKAEELIYLFFVELLKRHNTSQYSIYAADVMIMYKIRDKIAANLSITPDIIELTRFSNMSESKMNKVFKQIFGSSIYNYYQKLRMKEAAYLIREKKNMVSDVGYRLGFTNLSHFARLFEKHIGMKPKRYSSTA